MALSTERAYTVEKITLLMLVRIISAMTEATSSLGSQSITAAFCAFPRSSSVTASRNLPLDESILR